MCVVSNIGGYAQEMWPQPWQQPYEVKPLPYKPKEYEPYVLPVPYNGPTKEQFQELIELIKAGKRFDEKTGQPDCEVEDKKKFIRDLAKHLGVEIPEDLL